MLVALLSCFLGFMYLGMNLILGDQKSSNSGCINDFSITSKSRDGSRNLQLGLNLLTFFIKSKIKCYCLMIKPLTEV